MCSKLGSVIRKHLANALTLLRVVCSAVLAFVQPFTPCFYLLYITAGVSDFLDGIVARRLNTSNSFGAKLDTLADICFVAICLFKLLPGLNMPRWLYAWLAVISLIKACSIIYGYRLTGCFVAEHTILNKAVGGLLFMLPFLLPLLDIKLIALPICTLASIAAIQESFYVIKGKRIE